MSHVNRKNPHVVQFEDGNESYRRAWNVSDNDKRWRSWRLARQRTHGPEDHETAIEVAVFVEMGQHVERVTRYH